ncbi:MAG: hypothetical protein BWY47_01654 [Bacteroidetes bacterium ADurb.Bin302]|nr:MAG: hypothetical protein BWY47_01654 [Bacteroidetes bacterium ADurb.Bin302]
MKYYDANDKEIDKATYQQIVFKEGYYADYVNYGIYWYSYWYGHDDKIVASKREISAPEDI